MKLPVCRHCGGGPDVWLIEVRVEHAGRATALRIGDTSDPPEWEMMRDMRTFYDDCHPDALADEADLLLRCDMLGIPPGDVWDVLTPESHPVEEDRVIV